MGTHMAFSFKDEFYQRPNFAVLGTQIPDSLRRFLPPYANTPPIVPPDPNNPFGDPPHFHDVNPPEQNPYNDPDYSPFLVTEKQTAKVGDESDGGLLGMLRAVMQQDQVQPGADSPSAPNGTLENNSDGSGSPLSGLLDRLFALRGEGTPSAAQPSQGSSSTSQKPCRCLARRLAD
jgi:hypothetical protein